MTNPSMAQRALVVQQEAASPGGLVLSWLRSRGFQAETVRMDAEHEPVDLSRYRLIVPLGSEFAAYDDHIPWIGDELELLRQAHHSGASVLGICFGAQLLARALGAGCHRANRAEIGWVRVHSFNADMVSEGPWFQWHFDTFDLPGHAQLVAENDVGPQAFIAGQSMGVQFHPEVTPAIMGDWVSVYRHELDKEGVDPDGLLEETNLGAVEAERRSFALLDAFLERIVRPAEVS
ncbi:MAG TPA: type 1 glutamine amidotransferase [Acidimicrobiales bacterium]|nr:type 1 glutamine amidotransferase [Acidimicrobiales bacterium]